MTAENTTALIFSAENYSGTIIKIDSLGLNTAGYVKTITNYLFRSIIVTQINQGCIRIFTTKNLDGVNNSQQFCSSATGLNGSFDMAASLLIGSSIYKIVIYSGENFTGTSKELAESSYILDLSLERFTVIKSIVIVPKVNNDCVLVNDQCNYLGKSLEICGSIDKISSARDDLKNFSVKSVMVGSTYQARLYANENYEGNYISFSNEIGKTYSSCITDPSKENFSYTVNSILLTGKTPKFNCFMAFENCNFLGQRLEICFDVASSLAGKIPKISSIKTGSSTEVTIFDNDNYSKSRYNSVTFAKNDLTNQSCLTSNNTVLNAKSLKLNISTDQIILSDENCIKVFSQCNYNGSILEICTDIASKSGFPLLANFPISSFKLGSKNQVNFYQLDNYAGTSAIYSSDISKISSACVANDLNFVINSMQFISSTPKSIGVLLFSSGGFTGTRYHLTASNPDLSRTPFSSYKIGSLTKGYFYKEKDYGSSSTRRSFVFNDSNQSVSGFRSVEMGRDWNAPKNSSTEKEESLIVEAVKDPVRAIPSAQNECFIVFSGCDYSGDSKEYCEANGNVKGDIEKLSSVVVGENLLLNLYDGLNFSGNTIQLDESTSYRCLDELDFDEITNSIAVKIKDPNKFY